MKKIYLTLIIGTFLLAGTLAFVILDNGDILLEKEEFAQVTDNQIATYMQSVFKLTRYKVMDDKIIVYYNLTYIEPTQNENFSYKVFIQEKPFKIDINLYNKCMNVTTLEVCKQILVDNEELFVYNETIQNGNETEINTITIKSTYLQAKEEQIRLYEKAIGYRDKAIYNELDNLGDLI